MRTIAIGRRWVLAAAGIVVILAAVVWVVPRLLYPPLPASRFVGVAPDRRIELETNRLKLQGDARATLAQILAGGILLVGAYLTWRQLGVNREGQVTERYTGRSTSSATPSSTYGSAGSTRWNGSPSPHLPIAPRSARC